MFRIFGLSLSIKNSFYISCQGTSANAKEEANMEMEELSLEFLHFH